KDKKNCNNINNIRIKKLSNNSNTTIQKLIIDMEDNIQNKTETMSETRIRNESTHTSSSARILNETDPSLPPLIHYCFIIVVIVQNLADETQQQREREREEDKENEQKRGEMKSNNNTKNGDNVTRKSCIIDEQTEQYLKDCDDSLEYSSEMI
ncbi:hypothetical protein ACJMK2_024670, partial [Sinanodonta woodiana]